MKRFKFCFLLIVLFAAPMVARAAGDGCDDTDTNSYINNAIALCSTHAYNIGIIENPGDSAESATMTEAVALKSTIITQQMKKQYDFLELMVKRLKTQMEKAVLTAKMQAAGAVSEEKSSSSSSNRAAPFAGAEDCSVSFSNKDTVSCLQRNFVKIYSASNNGARLDANMKKQLLIDMQQIGNMKINNRSILSEQDSKDIQDEKYSDINKKHMDKMQSALKNANDMLESANQMMMMKN